MPQVKGEAICGDLESWAFEKFCHLLDVTWGQVLDIPICLEDQENQQLIVILPRTHEAHCNIPFSVKQSFTRSENVTWLWAIKVVCAIKELEGQ